MKKITLVLIALLSCILSFAQDPNDAVVYIQGDKETPIYVKMEGEMMDRFSKNYFVLNNLASPQHLEILFQQNIYPPQKFILNVQPSAQRSLALQKVSENKFALYDLNYGIYLPAGNKLADDIDFSSSKLAMNPEPSREENPKGVTATEPEVKLAKNTKEKTEKKKKFKEEVIDALPKFNPKPKAQEDNDVVVAEEPKKKIATEKEIADTTADPNFLNFEMDKAAKDNESVGGQTNSSVANNSNNCINPAGEIQFNSLLSIMDAYTDEEKKLKFVKTRTKSYCFSTAQVKTICERFELQSSRYDVARVLKAKVVDPEHYSDIAEVFNTNYLKNLFISDISGK